MKVLVTGGAGFIGSHLVDRLLAQGHEVYVLDDMSGGYSENLPQEAKVIVIDLRNARRAKVCIEQIKPEIIYHLAADAAENKAQFSPIEVTSRNWNAFINVLTPAINNGLKRFIFTSSIAVYGHGPKWGKKPFHESDFCQPADLYGITKLACEESLKVLSKVHGFEYVIVRPHNVFGPRQNMRDPYRNVVTIFMNALLKGEAYNIYGDGEQVRSFTYIDDLADPLAKCAYLAAAKNHTYNMGTDTRLTINELSKLIQEVAGKKIKPHYLPSRPQEVHEAVSNHSQADQVFGVYATPTKEALKRTWEWVEAQGPQDAKYQKLEINSPLIPENWK